MRAPLRLPLLAALLTLAACGGRGPARVEPAAEAQPAVPVADFSVYDLESRWRDQDGQDRALGSLRGKAQVVAMVYTSCTHTCPTIVAEMQRLQGALPAAERENVGFVLLSLDPERDSPAQLAKFAASFQLDPASWTLLTGDADAVREMAAVLDIRYREEADAQISHSNTYLVLDAQGRIVHRQEGVGQGTAAPLARIRAAAAR